MPVRDIFKFTRKTFVNPSGWLDWRFFSFQNNILRRVLSGLFIAETEEKKETFEEAVQRLGLTEADIQATQIRYQRFALALAAVGLLLMVYAFYLLFHHHTWTGWLLGMAAGLLLFGQAFRYDFWAFQMKQRKLGATFAEWKRYRLSV